ncbi:MAG TPA: hypothetical protein VJX91_09055 [Candidatus Eisenbacteria bacterium]|nr:hypothetical protein [Candidatus Eisenbacteria bacterium]
MAPARTGETGNAMVVALLVLMLLSSAAVAYVAVTKSEKQISGNARIATEAFYTAEAGLTEGIYRMSYAKDSVNYIGPATAFAGWGKYIVMSNGASTQDPNAANTASDGLDNNGNGMIDEPGERYPETPSKQTGGGSLQYPYVRVEYKTQSGQLVRYGDDDQNPTTPMRENFTYGDPVLKVSSVGTRGASKKVIEAEAVRFPLMNVNAAMWAGGPLGFNGNAFLLDGADHDADAPYDTVAGAPPVRAILTEGPTSDATVTSQQSDNVTGLGGDASIDQSTFTYDFNALWSSLSQVADQSFTGATSFSSASPTLGTLTSPKVTVVDGDLNIQGTWQGAGILMVNGNLSMGGGATYKGIVIATGDVRLAGGGPADVARILGAVIYQGSLINASAQGGSARVFWSSEAVQNALGMSKYTLAWWRER